MHHSLCLILFFSHFEHVIMLCIYFVVIGSPVIEKIVNIDTIAVDKTGTLTKV